MHLEHEFTELIFLCLSASALTPSDCHERWHVWQNRFVCVERPPGGVLGEKVGPFTIVWEAVVLCDCSVSEALLCCNEVPPSQFAKVWSHDLDQACCHVSYGAVYVCSFGVGDRLSRLCCT